MKFHALHCLSRQPRHPCFLLFTRLHPSRTLGTPSGRLRSESRGEIQTAPCRRITVTLITTACLPAWPACPPLRQAVAPPFLASPPSPWSIARIQPTLNHFGRASSVGRLRPDQPTITRRVTPPSSNLLPTPTHTLMLTGSPSAPPAALHAAPGSPRTRTPAAGTLVAAGLNCPSPARQIRCVPGPLAVPAVCFRFGACALGAPGLGVRPQPSKRLARSFPVL